ncbi:MAG: MFS transporter, partial [Candidatus Heimdallarchaeota archaeon]|nr:MFS transporter [Candidatus Heimdallarchaeota archaeon]
YIPSKYDFRNYLQFYAGQIISMLGSSIVSFTIIWYITITYSNPNYLSMAYFCTIGIQVFVQPLGGVIADRFDRKKVIFAADTLIAVGTLMYMLLFLFESRIDKMVFLYIILAIICFRAFVTSFQWPVTSSIIPMMVPKEQLSRLNGIRHISWGAINIAGPAIGAILFAVWPLNNIILIDTVTYFIALVPLYLLKLPKTEKNKEETKSTSKGSFGSEFKEGIKFILSTKGLFALFLIATFINFFQQPIFVLRPIFVEVFHGGTEKSLAWIVGMGQVGVFVSGTVVILKKTWKKKTMILMIAFYVQIVGYLIQSLAPQGNILVLCVGTLVMGLTFPFTNTMLQTIAQILVPPEMMGRVSSIMQTMCMALMPIAIIVAGPLANAIGYVPLFVGSILMGAISITGIWIFSKVRQIDPIVEELERKEKELKKIEENLIGIKIEKEGEGIPFPAAAD